MTRMIGVWALCLLLLLPPAAALGFECMNPPFGAGLAELNRNGDFVKYMEKGGVAYYNYVGPCRLNIHDRANPAISWAFIQDQLYARVIRCSNDSRELLEKTLLKQWGPPKRVTREGDWTVYIRQFDNNTKTFKAKFNNRTRETKLSFYHEPLRAKLKDSEKALDPANLD
ncbi:MAG: hypothetical protein V1816_25625 [Pseudomonadota bacterium]